MNKLVIFNAFFANPDWKKAIDFLLKARQPVNLHGVDIRTINEEQAFYLNKMHFKKKVSLYEFTPLVMNF